MPEEPRIYEWQTAGSMREFVLRRDYDVLCAYALSLREELEGEKDVSRHWLKKSDEYFLRAERAESALREREGMVPSGVNAIEIIQRITHETFDAASLGFNMHQAGVQAGYEEGARIGHSIGLEF